MTITPYNKRAHNSHYPYRLESADGGSLRWIGCYQFRHTASSIGQAMRRFYRVIDLGGNVIDEGYGS